MNKKVCILGGTGFIGSHLASALVRAGYTINILSRSNAINSSLTTEELKQCTFVKGDFANENVLRTLMSGCSYCFHLISTLLPAQSNLDPIADIEQNIAGSVRVINVARDLGIKKIIFSSSGGTVYGKSDAESLSEDHATNPTCSYGIAKLAVEKYLQMYEDLYGLDYTILRIANPYGVLRHNNCRQGLISVFLSNLASKRQCEIWGKGDVVRDYIYIDDVINAMLLSMSCKATTFNIGSGKGYSINDIVHYINKVTKMQLNVVYKKSRDFDIERCVLNIDKAKTILKWEPKICLEEGILKTWLMLNGLKNI